MPGKPETNGREAIPAGSNGLPDGWASAPLGQLISPSKEKTEPSSCPDAPYLSLEHIESCTNRIESHGRASAVTSTKAVFHSGDVLYGKLRPYLNKVTIPNFDGVCSTDILVFRPSEGVLPEYLLRFLSDSSFVRYATDHQKGNSLPRVSFGDLAKYPLPLPPLAEQKRIVAKVEALLERVSKARERLGRVPDILKKFRQSVLAAACSGRLTADWREDDEDSDDLPPTWERRKLSTLCKKFQYGSSSKSESEGQIPVLRMGNIQDGEIDWSDLKFTSDKAEIQKYALEPNTVLFNRTNSPELVGKTGIYRGERPAAFAGYLIRIHHGAELDPDYLNYCLNAYDFREYCNRVKSDGVSQSNINAKKLAAYEMPWCVLDEQREVVRRVKSLFKVASRIEQYSSVGTKHAGHITQSVLAKAFAGELVETEADLARREGRDYEPASAMLNRISGKSASAASAVQVEKGHAILDILLLLEAWGKTVSISALEPALVLMRNEAARQTLLSDVTTPRQRRSMANEPSFVVGLDTIYQGLIANGAVRKAGRSGLELANSRLLAKATSADRDRAAETLQAIQTLSNLRSLPSVVAAITNERYEITV